MKPIQISRTIKAPLEAVFRTVSDIRNYSKAVPQIVKIEFVSAQQQGAGTRFRETRMMKGRAQTTELAIAEYVENEHVRFVSDAGGTIWDTVFTVTQAQEGIELQLHMDARPHKLPAKLITPLIRGMVVKGVASDLDAIKTFCETSDTGA